MKRLRVLTISKPYVGASYRHKLGLWAARGDMDVALISPEAWGDQKFEQTRDVGKDSVDFNVSIKILPIVLNGKNHFHLYRGLNAAVAQFRPDIVNVEEEHYSAVTWQCFRAALRVGARPLFYTWQNINKRYPPPFSWIEQFVFSKAFAGVAGNSEAADILKAKGFRGLVRVIPQMGVDMNRFAPASMTDSSRRAQKKNLGLTDDCFWIGFAGRLVEEKGIDDLLRAVKKIPDHLRVRVAIIGSGPQSGHLQRLTTTLGLENVVRFVEFVQSASMPDWLQALDVICLPSLTRPNWKEQFGRILVEAMAAGAVVVGSSSGEIPLVIGEAGFIFPEGDHSDLSDIFSRLAGNPQLCAAYQTAGAVRARKFFSNEVVADAFASLFHEVAAGTGR